MVCFILGKFQMTRDKQMVHQYTEVESVEQGNKFNVSTCYPTFDGKTFGRRSSL